MPRPIWDSVVVITGASSGIGRATSLDFARRGATVVLAARREALLHEVAQECADAGGRALVVPTDVTDERGVQELARSAVESFGGIDVWVNNAAVTVFAPFEEAPPEDYRRVIETNLFGYVYGARAALPIFRRQGGGVLINIGSVNSVVPGPYASAYVMSKYAVRALGASLRQELALDGARNIHVCTVMPATIDTPFFQHSGNYTGLMVKPLPPVYTAERVAETIVGLVERPRREVFVGNAARMMATQWALAPAAMERQMATAVDRLHLHHGRPMPPNSGNLFRPMMEGSGISGGWQGESAERTRRYAMAGMAALGLLGWRWLRQRNASEQRFGGNGRGDHGSERGRYDVDERRIEIRQLPRTVAEPVRGR